MQHVARPLARIAYRSGTGVGLRATAHASYRARGAMGSSCESAYPRYASVPVRFYSQKQDDKSLPNESHPDTRKSPPLPNMTTEQLPSTKDKNRSPVNQKFSQVMDNLQARVLTASQTLNDITGYSSIDSIKAENDALEKSLAEAQERLRTARQAYKTSNAKRASTQREVTTLLARKDSWSPVDLERFTELYRTDHVLEGEVVSAQESLTESEAEEQSLNQQLNAGILKRYHEEQIWSDRIRRASTWGTWGLMGMNFLLFIVFQFFAEPWRRRRLVKGVVEQEEQVLEKVRGEMASLKADLDSKLDKITSSQQPESPIPTQRPPLSDCQVPVYKLSTWQEFLQDPQLWKEAAMDLYSARRVEGTMRDVSAAVLEGALAGAVVATSIALLVARQS